MMLYRPDYYSGEKDDDAGDEGAAAEANIAEVIVAKNRHGAQGISKLAWYGSTFRFVSVDEDTNEPD